MQLSIPCQDITYMYHTASGVNNMARNWHLSHSSASAEAPDID